MYQRILVGTDGSETAARAVDRAVEVARVTGAELTIFSAGRPELTKKVVDKEAARHSDSGVKIETETAEGDAASALIERAERGDIDLLVMGNKGMTGATRFLFGSVPNKVSHHASVALLIVRTT